MKTFSAAREKILDMAAENFISGVKELERANVLICSGPDEIALLERISSLCIERGTELRNVTVLCACEFSKLDISDERSCFSRISRALSGSGVKSVVSPVGIEDFDTYINTIGGIDMAVIGLGLNAAIAFNEPGVQYGSYTHLQKLTVKTQAMYADSFGDEESVPGYGVTAGIKTLVSARNILVIALGESKAAPVYLMLYARDDSVVPAAFLQLPMNVGVYLDTEAASRL